MNYQSPFRVMASMWGIKAALKKCKELGIDVSDEELKEAEEKENDFLNARLDLIKEINTANE